MMATVTSRVPGSPRSGVVGPAPVLGSPQAVVDLLADRADGELVRVAPGHPDLAAQRDHRLARQRRRQDLLLADVVREALVVAGLDRLLELLALEQRGALRVRGRLRQRLGL